MRRVYDQRERRSAQQNIHVMILISHLLAAAEARPEVPDWQSAVERAASTRLEPWLLKESENYHSRAQLLLATTKIDWLLKAAETEEA